MHFQYNLLISFSIIDITLIIDLFRHKETKNAFIFHCNQNQNLYNISKMLNYGQIKIAAVNINDKTSFKLPSSYQKIGIVIDTNCERWDSVLELDSVSFESIYPWIIFTDNLSETTKILSKYPIEINSDITVATQFNNSFNLYEVYNSGSRFGGTFNVINVGQWDSFQKIRKSERRNMQGIVVKLAVVQLREDKLVNKTIEHHMETPEVKVDTMHRMKYFTLFKYLRDMFNMSYEIQRVSSWGYLRNGSFDGMVGALSNGTAEIGGAPIFFRRDRTMFIQYISQTWHSRHCFIFRHPKHSGRFYTIYTRPLTTVVWYCAISLVLLSTLLLWITLWVKKNSTDDSSPSLALLTIWGAFCQQGSFLEHHSTSVKLVLFNTFVCAVTMYQYYNATIVSSLLQDPPKNIRTLKDLVDSDLKVGVDDVIYDRDYFKRTTDPVALKLYKNKIINGPQHNFFNSNEGMALVKAGGFAFHVDTTIAFSVIKETFTEREICELSTLELYPLQKMAVVVRRFSPLKEHIAYGILKMYESGLPVRVQAVFDTPTPKCVHTPDSSTFRVDIEEFSMPLVALAGGVATAFVVFLCELLLAKAVQNEIGINFKK